MSPSPHSDPASTASGRSIAVRAMERDEIAPMVDYFLDAPPDFHRRLGIDPDRLPSHDEWCRRVLGDLDRPLADRESSYLVWLIDGRPAGHCNLNDIEFGKRARLHLHLWESGTRRAGIGARLVKESAEQFCARFELDEIYSEPNAGNEAPNRTLAKAGFRLEKTYETTPGWINAHQLVNRWSFRCGRSEHGPETTGT